MATKPTVRIPLWASGGTTTDPGASKEAAGWLVSERPPAEWWNWLLNTAGEWITYLRESQGPQVAFDSITKTTTSLGNTSTRAVVQYLPNNGKWMAALDDSGVDIYDSTDGITWSSATGLAGTSGVMTRFVEVGTDVFIGADDNIYRSTNGLASGFTALNPTFNLIDDIRGLQWDSTNSLWIASGTQTSGTNGQIETLAQAVPNGTFTQRVSVAGIALGACATNSSGLSIVCQQGGSNDIRTSSNGTTWATNSSPTAAWRSILWNDALGLFVGVDSSKQLHLTEDGTSGSGFNSPTQFQDVYAIMNTPEGVVMYMSQTDASNPGAFILLSNSSNPVKDEHWQYRVLGIVEASADVNVFRMSAYNDDTSYIETGNYQWTWLYTAGSNEYLAYAQF